ncbi:ABC1 kinase family protein [Nocardia wallacei]|uniref:ABC1 kinase family protein n=1 Tax=Nocardia wallacei TaxID=480035 RepID=UPI002456A343|nr:AarF/ABC1/UbiB kinase family protein [Nocardia wallacei]
MVDVPTSRLARGGRLGKFAAQQAVRNARLRFDRFARGEPDREAADAALLRAADELVGLLGGMKGAAMKVGQMLSVIDIEMIPRSHRERFRSKLAALRDRAPSVPFERMRPVLEEDLGRPLGDAFAEFDTEPVAAASIGQVYRARLADGRAVAVKVQYAGIAGAVRADLKNLALLLKMSKPMFPGFSAAAFMDELRLHLEQELDYLHEAATQHELAVFYAGHPAILVPDTVSGLCGPRVLVTEYVDGARFDDVCTRSAAVRDRVGEIVFRFYIGALFHDLRFNGDPHPGNVLLTADGRVAFLDFGLFKRMRREAVELERDGMRAAMEGRADALRDVMCRSGALRAESPVTADQLLEYVYDASPWTFDDEELTMSTDIAGGAFMVVADPRSRDFDRMRREDLPPEHFFSRRADFYTFGMLGQLGATANWHRIAREWVYGDPPATEVGVLDAAWRAGR